MPYGVDRSLGGDNDKNTMFMEKCVTSVMKGGKDKSSAIAICKAQMKKNHEKNHDKNMDAEFTGVDPDILNKEYMKKQGFINSLRQSKLVTFAQAEAEYYVFLAKTNFEL